MNNRGRGTFEKNRYYYGKMLTVSDFQTEQNYICEKQMLLNSVTFGAGVLCGLTVKRLDDKSVRIDSGAAIDGLGRIVVSEKTCVKQLDTMKGYETLTGDKALLCLAYQEDEVQEVRVVGQKSYEDEYQYNHIRETHEWYVTDWKEENQLWAVPSFCTETVLVREKDYCVSIFMPRYICKDKMTKLTLRIQKLTDEKKALNLYGFLQLPAFTTEKGEKELDICQEEIYLEEGERCDAVYWLIPAAGFEGKTKIFPKPDTDRVIIGNETVRMSKFAKLQVTVTKDSPQALAQNSAGKKNLEETTETGMEDIPVAVLCLEEKDGVYRITQVENAGVRRYISLPGQQEEKEEFLSYYKEIPPIKEDEPPVSKEEEDQPGERRQEEPLIRGGTIEIPLDVKMKKGKVCYSEEIVHGLGTGNVYIDVGIKQEPDMTVYGDNSLFVRDGVDTVIRTAVKVFRKKGSFQVAVSVMGEQNTVILNLYWVAVKVPVRNKKADV